jgi:ABC-type lipopolysaccharide export system ATPase subunit
MIEVSSLTKTYGKKRGVDRISFTIGEGEIVGFLGPQRSGENHDNEYYNRLSLRQFGRGKDRRH